KTDPESKRCLRASNCCCATRRAGSNRRSAPMTTASTAISNCRSRTGTKNTGCGSNDGHQNKRPIVGAILPNVRDRPSIWEMSVQDPTKRDPTSWTADKKALYPPSHRFNREQHDGRQDQENVTKMVSKGDTGHGLDGSRQRRASLLGTGCDEV